MKNVVIFSSNKYSLYTIAVTEMLHRRGISISAIIVRRLASPKRFFYEFSHKGIKALHVVLKHLILRERNSGKKTDYENIVDFMLREGISHRTLNDFWEKYNIPIVYCGDLNDQITLDTLEQIHPNIVVYTGGGLIRESVLKKSGDGVLNCHPAILPYYRGNDVVQWTLLEGHRNDIGITIHFMDTGVDTGDILRIKKIDVKSSDTINDIYARIKSIKCSEMVDVCIDWLEGRIERHTQINSKSHQYFCIHRNLEKLISSMGV
jgi:methionyl-tRNA formyltransferase